MSTQVNQRDPAEEKAILDAIEVWVEKEVRPIAKKFDLADEYPHDLVEQMKELGLFGATISPEYGGLGLSAWTYAQIVIKVTVCFGSGGLKVCRCPTS